MNLLGIYFSGTGNTKYCVNTLIKGLDEKGLAYSIEDKESIAKIRESDFIIFGYPIYYSNLPKIVKEYIINNKEIFINKKIFVVVTMGLFSGDGVGCSARVFKKIGAQVLGGIHVKMPDCIGDIRLLKKSDKVNYKIMAKAKRKLMRTAYKIKHHHIPKQGMSICSQFLGFFGQRLYFRNPEKYYKKIKADSSKCIGCGLCAIDCPMANISIIHGTAQFNSVCTLCYRCFSKCPTKAITILGKKVYSQWNIEKIGEIKDE